VSCFTGSHGKRASPRPVHCASRANQKKQPMNDITPPPNLLMGHGGPSVGNRFCSRTESRLPRRRSMLWARPGPPPIGSAKLKPRCVVSNAARQLSLRIRLVLGRRRGGSKCLAPLFCSCHSAQNYCVGRPKTLARHVVCRLCEAKFLPG